MMRALPVGAGRAEGLRSAARRSEAGGWSEVSSLSALARAVGSISGGVAEWLKASRLKRPRDAAERGGSIAVGARCRSQFGGVAEWLKASRLKRDDRKVRGFESYPLRHLKTVGLFVN